MANDANRSGKATTAPKGRPTPRRGAVSDRSRISPRLQWFLLVLALVVVAIGLWLVLDGASWGDDVLQGAPQRTSSRPPMIDAFL